MVGIPQLLGPVVKQFNDEVATNRRERSAEDTVDAILKTLDEKQYSVFRNVYRGYGDLDHVVVGPTGIFVIETNTYEGVITGRETKTMWTDVMAYGKVKSHIYNPIRENESHLLAIHELLKPIGDYKLEGIVVFLKNAQLFVQANEKALIKPCSIKAYIANHVVQKLSETQMKKIYDFLVEAKIKGVATPSKE